MPAQQFPYPFNDIYQGIVGSDRRLELEFGPPPNQMWSIEQITYEMADAPAGCVAGVYYQNVLHAPGFSARKGAIAGEPPLMLRGGEMASVVWTDSTSGVIGKALVIYRKFPY